MRPLAAIAFGLTLVIVGGCAGSGGQGAVPSSPPFGEQVPIATPTLSGPAAPASEPTSEFEPHVEHPPAGRPGWEAPDRLEGLIVALDPGHNGGNTAAPEIVNRPVDAGGFQKPCNTTGTATNDGYPEHRFNLEVALVLREQLEARGAGVELTRETDDGVGPCIDERGGFAAAVGADVLVSLHADGGPSGGSGFHVIHPLTAGSIAPDEVVARSTELATLLRDALVDAGFTPADYTARDGLSPRDDLGTLNLAAVPAVLLEAGNMRNADDARALTSAEGQARLADAVVAALEKFADG